MLTRVVVVSALAIVAVLACGASVSSADALCEDKPQVAEEEEACVVPYAEKTELKASSKKVVLAAKEFEERCESTLGGKTEKDLGEKKGLEGKVESLSFFNCEGACSAASASSLPYKAVMKATGEGNGNVVLSSSGSGNPGLKLTCVLGTTCTYEAGEPSLAFKGGQPASIVASGVPVTRTSGTFCPATGTITATYELQQPNSGKARLAPGKALIQVEPVPHHFPGVGQETLKVKNPAGGVGWKVLGFVLVSGEYSFTDPAPPNTCAGKRLLATQECSITIRCLVSPAANATLTINSTFFVTNDPLSCG